MAYNNASRFCGSSPFWVVFERVVVVLVAVIVLAAAPLSASSSFDPPSTLPTFTCSNADDYYYAVPGSRCSAYYRCNHNGTRLVLNCPPAANFDFFKQVCTRSAGICYEPVCTGRTDGTYQDTTHACRRSLTCQHGRLSALDNCPSGQLHDGHRCRSQEETVCNLPQSTAIAYPYAADRRCLGLQPGRHVAVATECKRYIMCGTAGDVLDDIECADGWLYDEVRGQCMPENQLTSGLCAGTTDAALCRGQSDGLHADPMAEDCESYVRCAGGRFVSREWCSSGQAVFNGERCVLRPLYECPASERHFPKRDLCKHRTDGMWADPRLGCRAYVRCERGISAEPLMCGSRDQYFDPEQRRCRPNAGGGQCRMQTASAECALLERGFYQDKTEASSCRRYFHCYNGHRVDYECSRGKVFDGENCVGSSTYECPNKSPETCDGRADGYYKDVHASCRAYYLCSQGRKFRYACGEEERFDGVECVRRKADEVCANMGACLGRPDGYYADAAESKCRNYFFCLKQEVLTTLTCHGSKVYNGHKCVTPAEFACPQLPAASTLLLADGAVVADGGSESQQIDCVPRPDGWCRDSVGQCDGNGFFADIASGCVEYYFCIGSTQSGVLRCNDGYVFNGEVCVRRERYTCPQYCNDASGGVDEC